MQSSLGYVDITLSAVAQYVRNGDSHFILRGPVMLDSEPPASLTPVSGNADAILDIDLGGMPSAHCAKLALASPGMRYRIGYCNDTDFSRTVTSFREVEILS